MMNIHPQFVLAIVGLVLLALGMLDVVKYRRITPAAKGRLLTACIFALVLLWLRWQGQ